MHDSYFDHEPQGEFRGDFSRDTFDPLRHFSRVLMQQGRVQLDADWNEQVSILLHYLQTLAADLIGPYAGPSSHFGFEIVDEGAAGDFSIGKGRYYVNGILCENEAVTTFLNQPDPPGQTELTDGRHLVYLDVWERHITPVEDDRIREKALGGADTATRAKIVWQVRVMKFSPTYAYARCMNGTRVLDEELLVISQACLRARAKKASSPVEPCLVAPEARYRGQENQLYRVEVHTGSQDEDGNPVSPTFKWSRENGSVVFPIKKLTDSETVTLELAHLGNDSRFCLVEGDWVEIVDDAYTLNHQAKALLRVQSIDSYTMTIILQKKAGEHYAVDMKKHPLLRRWDQKNDVSEDGVLPLAESGDWEKGWIAVEDGVSIQFKPGGTYRSGDYWLIPARTVLGDVEWPKIRDEATGDPVMDAKGNRVTRFLPPHGVLHHFAPLAIITVADGSVSREHDCRCQIRPLSYACAYSYLGQLGIGVDLICPEEI
jgi:hypothetical protein